MDVKMRDAGVTTEGKARPHFRLSPQLGDGCNSEIADDVDEIINRIWCWLEEFKTGYDPHASFSVEVVMMTDAEVEALPEL